MIPTLQALRRELHAERHHHHHHHHGTEASLK